MTTFEAPRVEVVENALEPGTSTQPRRRVKRRTINTVIWFVVLLAFTAIVLAVRGARRVLGKSS